MSLGKHTKCDLSAGVAKLDLEKLTKQVELHFYSLMNRMREKVSAVQYDTVEINNRKHALSSMSSIGADEVMALAKNIAETSELLHTLFEATNRKIEIV